MRTSSFIFGFFVFFLGGLYAQDEVSTSVKDKEVIQRPIDDRKDVKRGFYSGLGTGMFYFTDATDRQTYRDGWLIAFKIGYDLFKYFGLETQYRLSFHDTAPQGTAQGSVPRSYRSHQLLGILRGGYPISRRWQTSLEAGGGLWVTAPNVKPNISGAGRGQAYFALNIQYFFKMRGLGVGLDPSLSLVSDMKGPVLQASGYLRYVF